MPTTAGMADSLTRLPIGLPSIRAAAVDINAMPRTLFDKIWDFHCVGQRSDGRDLIYIDRHVLHELHAHHAFAQLAKAAAGRCTGRT